MKSTDYEYDLNVVFKQPKSSVHISNLGDDYRYTLLYLFIVEAESHIFTENQTLRQLEATATTLAPPGRSFLRKIARTELLCYKSLFSSQVYLCVLGNLQ